MRVLIYVGDAQWNGSSRALLAAARGLVAREHSVTIACCGDSRLDREAREAGVETAAINGASTTAGGAWDLRKLIKERFIEVVLVASERDQLVVSSARAVRRSRRGASPRPLVREPRAAPHAASLR